MEVGSRVFAQIVRRFLPAYRRVHRLSVEQRKAVRAMVACKTPALGGQEYGCARCGQRHILYHACRNRHCPECQGLRSRQWVQSQEAKLLPIGYYHAIFTVPACLRVLIAYNRRALYGLLFSASSAAMQELAADGRWLGARLGFVGILHTWGQQLAFHPHVHYLVTGGGVDAQGRWIGPRTGGRFLLPVLRLSEVFRDKWLRGVRRLHAAGELASPAGLDVAGILSQAAGQSWEVYLQAPVAGPTRVLEYLGRYTHRVALSPSRILRHDERTVCFGYRDYRRDGIQCEMQLAGVEFLGRFLQHVLPHGFRRIRQYGLWSGANAAQLLAVREQLVTLRCLVLAHLGSWAAEPQPAQSPFAPACPSCQQPMLKLGSIGPRPHDSS